MSIRYFFYHASWLQFFKLSEFSFFLVKMVNRYVIHVTFQHIEHQLQKIFCITFFILAFYKTFFAFRCFFNPLKANYMLALWHCPSTKIIYFPILKTWWFFIFFITFHIFVGSFYLSSNSMTHSSCNIFFYH